jgi:hypothetical protein
VKVFGNDPTTIEQKKTEIELALRPVPGVADLYSERITGAPYLEIKRLITGVTLRVARPLSSNRWRPKEKTSSSRFSARYAFLPRGLLAGILPAGP